MAKFNMQRESESFKLITVSDDGDDCASEACAKSGVDANEEIIVIDGRETPTATSDDANANGKKLAGIYYVKDDHLHAASCPTSHADVSSVFNVEKNTSDAKVSTSCKITPEEESLTAPSVTGTGAAASEAGKGDDVDENYVEPRPFARRVVITLCVIGFLVIVAYILRYRGVIELPF